MNRWTLMVLVAAGVGALTGIALALSYAVVVHHWSAYVSGAVAAAVAPRIVKKRWPTDMVIFKRPGLKISVSKNLEPRARKIVDDYDERHRDDEA